MTISSAPVGSVAWIQLLHGEVCWTLARAGIRAMVIKGPTIADWLYPDEARISADVDLLVPPEEFQKAVAALNSRDFVDYADGVRESERTPHALTFTRTDPHVGGHQVDLHRYFPGIEVDSGTAFGVLWDRRGTSTAAGVPVWFPDLPSRALIIVLHAARGTVSGKVLEDQRRAWTVGGIELFRQARELALDLNALPAFRVGLESIDETRHLVEALDLGQVPVPPAWALRNELASGTAVHLEQALERPWRERPGFVFAWLFPSPAAMRLRDPSVGRGATHLAKAYASRIALGARSLPDAVRAVRSARRR